MTSLTFYGGVNEIGGNKILLATELCVLKHLIPDV